MGKSPILKLPVNVNWFATFASNDNYYNGPNHMYFYVLDP